MTSKCGMPTTRVTVITVIDDADETQTQRCASATVRLIELVHARANISPRYVRVLCVPARELTERLRDIRAAMALKSNVPSRINVTPMELTFPCVFFNVYAMGGEKEFEKLIKMDGPAAVSRAALATNDDVFDAHDGALDVFNRAFVIGDVVDGDVYVRSARRSMMERTPSRTTRRVDGCLVLNDDVGSTSGDATKGSYAPEQVVSELLELLRSADGEHEDALKELKSKCATVSSRFRSAPPLSTVVDENMRKSFLLNLYNAAVKHAILIHGAPTNSSIARARFYRHNGYDVGGEFYSLDDIEHGLLRADAPHPSSGALSRVFFGRHRSYFSAGDVRARAAMETRDARIHFALNCGATSCPPVRMYNAAKLNQQLDLAARAYINATTRVKESKKAGHFIVELSKLFKWYASDFTDDGRGKARDVLRFVARFLNDNGTTAHALDQPTSVWRITYAPYDWNMSP